MIRICQTCRKRRATGKHHLFSQTKLNRQVYPEYIDHPWNIRYLCDECHLNSPVDKLTEKEFCMMFEIKPRTKSGMDLYEREPWTCS